MTSTLPERRPWTQLHAELERSRRYTREFALVRLRRRPDADLTEAGGPRRIFLRPARPALHNVAEMLRGVVRVIDHVRLEHPDTYVLLPESTRDSAIGFIARVQALAPAALDGADVAIACFPDDAQTSGRLLAALDEPAAAVLTPRREVDELAEVLQPVDRSGARGARDVMPVRAEPTCAAYATATPLNARGRKP